MNLHQRLTGTKSSRSRWFPVEFMGKQTYFRRGPNNSFSGTYLYLSYGMVIIVRDGIIRWAIPLKNLKEK